MNTISPKASFELVLKSVWPLDLRFTAKLNGSAVKLKTSSDPEISWTVIGDFLDFPMTFPTGGGCSRGRRL